MKATNAFERIFVYKLYYRRTENHEENKGRLFTFTLFLSFLLPLRENEMKKKIEIE